MPHKNPLHIPLRDIPPQGKRYEVNETHVWEDPLQEFRMDCRLVSAPCMQLTILPTDEGWLLRGRIGAKVVVPCCRCAKDMEVEVDEPFEDYVQAPDEGEALAQNDFSEGDDHLLLEHGALMLDLAAIAWEQFALALPPTPVCRPDCKGLCPHCGADLNQGPCSCPKDEGDPRLAVLRGLKVEKA